MSGRIVILFIAIPMLILSLKASAEPVEQQLALPMMAGCASVSVPHPVLPAKWHGAFLMAPFTKTQLVLGEFTADDTVSAMRVRLYGLRHGALDILIKGRKTYLLGRDGATFDMCLDLGDTRLRPLPRNLLAKDAQCVGSAPVGAVEADWWKTPSHAKPAADWLWFKKADGSPFRIMFTQPAPDRSILGSFTLSYQTSFQSLSETSLAEDVRKCQAEARPVSGPQAGIDKMIANMEQSSWKAEADLARLMPELNTSCAGTPLPGWPERSGMTAFMTSPNIDSRPLPTEIIYDWHRQSQRTRMVWPSTSRIATDDALLLGAKGYNVTRSRKGAVTCERALPGTLHPNWPETGGCSCEAVINGRTSLTPHGSAQILVCPMTAPRVVWSWFALDRRPIVFMESSAPGDSPSGVLTLVDYHAWAPGHQASKSIFEAAPECHAGSDKAIPALASSHGHRLQARRCGFCHLDRVPH